jgi:hypothetical protein
MSTIVNSLFGSGGGDGVAKALAEQERQQRTSLASAVNNEAAVDQDLAKPRRQRGGRRLLEYLDGGSETLGG